MPSSVNQLTFFSSKSGVTALRLTLSACKNQTPQQEQLKESPPIPTGTIQAVIIPSDSTMFADLSLQQNLLFYLILQ